MKKTKRYISGITVLIMAAGLLQACGGDQPGEVTTGQGDTETTTVETEAPKETPSVTQADFGGAEINFMIDTVVQWDYKNDLGLGEQNGDGLNDAYYDRNHRVEDALNVRISNTKTEYDLVRNNGWTFDKSGEMCSVVASDIDGNGEYDENDRYALIWDDSMIAAVNAVGEKCCTVVDGKVELTLNAERTVNSVSKYLSVVGDKTRCFAYQRYTGDTTEIDKAVFTSDRSLFFLELLDTCLRRGMVPRCRRLQRADHEYIPQARYGFQLDVCEI